MTHVDAVSLAVAALKAGRCEAILVANSGRHVAGEQCQADATGTVDGSMVCWLHRRAVNNPHRSEPVRFVRQEAEILRALGVT